jgi:hypothetical protein
MEAMKNSETWFSSAQKTITFILATVRTCNITKYQGKFEESKQRIPNYVSPFSPCQMQLERHGHKLEDNIKIYVRKLAERLRSGFIWLSIGFSSGFTFNSGENFVLTLRLEG